jgi:hypothetical protein
MFSTSNFLNVKNHESPLPLGHSHIIQNDINNNIVYMKNKCLKNQEHILPKLSGDLYSQKDQKILKPNHHNENLMFQHHQLQSQQQLHRKSSQPQMMVPYPFAAGIQVAGVHSSQNTNGLDHYGQIAHELMMQNLRQMHMLNQQTGEHFNYPNIYEHGMHHQNLFNHSNGKNSLLNHLFERNLDMAQIYRANFENENRNNEMIISNHGSHENIHGINRLNGYPNISNSIFIETQNSKKSFGKIAHNNKQKKNK